MNHPGPLDYPFVALAEVIGLGGCPGRMRLLGLDEQVCEAGELARAALDMHDRASSDREASQVLHEFVRRFAQSVPAVSDQDLVQIAMRLSRPSTSEEQSSYTWWVLMEYALVEDSGLPPDLDHERVRSLAARLDAIEQQERPQDNRWERDYRRRHPDVDPDTTIRLLWLYEEVARLLAEVKGPALVRLMEWARAKAEQLRLDAGYLEALWSRSPDADG